MFEDRLLITRLRHGSKEALCRIYEKYESDLLTLAGNLLSDAAAAEDVVQDVFISFVQSAETFRLRSSLKGYLVTCVANRSRDSLRKRNRRRTVAADEVGECVSDADGPVQMVIKSEELRRLSLAMTELPYEQQEAVVLHLHGGLRFREIANLQDVSIKTAQSRYRYGLDKLRSILNGEVEK